jgi:hypothetical protein
VGALRAAGQAALGVVRVADSLPRPARRIEPRIETVEGCVRILDLWWEDGFVPRRDQGFVDAMWAALRAYFHVAGASSLEWAKHLGMERQLFPTRPQDRGRHPVAADTTCLRRARPLRAASSRE